MRTVAKAVGWNLLGLTSMTLIGLLATGSLRLGGGLAVANTAVGFLAYLFYERIWDRIGWGRHG